MARKAKDRSSSGRGTRDGSFDDLLCCFEALEESLDEAVGRGLLQDVRLGLVLRTRARLLCGPERNAVQTFAAVRNSLPA